MLYLNQEELEVGLAKWQKILRLQDWDVQIRLCHPNDMTECHGDVNEVREHKVAWIRISSEKPDTRIGFKVHDAEEVLVHELIHLHLNPIKDIVDPSAKLMALEQATSVIARTLVAAARGEYGP